MKNKNPEGENAESASELIQRIKAGGLDPAILTKEQRQMCVEALFFDSVSPTGIAQFLKVNDRTIRRDMEDIRVKNALAPDPALARQVVGEHVLFARIHRGNLMKLARNSEASTSERAQAEYYAYMVGADLIVKLQSLGYLPKSADALLVLQKNEATDENGRLTTILNEVEDMRRLENDPIKAEKLLEIEKTISKEKENDDKQEGA
jgi:hypothetical protein